MVQTKASIPGAGHAGATNAARDLGGLAETRPVADPRTAGAASPVRLPPMQPNRTGLPDTLKAGVERLSGLSMDDVRVHRDSPEPAKLGALAFARGADIHLAPRQERHLPHEAWHVAQQKQGRVAPTDALETIPLNEQPALEAEAERMGAIASRAPALQTDSTYCTSATAIPTIADSSPVVQRVGAKTTGAATMGLLGALLGSLFPVVGTLGGTVLGGLLGALGGHLYERATRKPDVHWKFYLNPQDFGRASGEENPGGIYDSDKSPGYQQSMVRALQEEVFGGKKGGRIDYQEYVRLHDLVTSHLRPRETGMSSGTIEHIRTPSSGEEGTAFPINDWDREAKTSPANDLLDEEILGMPMVLPVVGRNMEIENKEARKIGERESVTAFVPDLQRIHVRYSEEDGPRIVAAILDRYYQEIGDAQDSHSPQDAKLTAIVKAIRALHVTHPFKDANGRLHAQLMLNRFLVEQGFGKTIMPEKEGLGVFGGAFSLEQLKAMVREGFKTAAVLPGGGAK